MCQSGTTETLISQKLNKIQQWNLVDILEVRSNWLWLDFIVLRGSGFALCARRVLGQWDFFYFYAFQSILSQLRHIFSEIFLWTQNAKCSQAKQAGCKCEAQSPREWSNRVALRCKPEEALRASQGYLGINVQHCKRLYKRSRSQIKVKLFGFSGAVFIIMLTKLGGEFTFGSGSDFLFSCHSGGSNSLLRAHEICLPSCLLDETLNQRPELFA